MAAHPNYLLRFRGGARGEAKCVGIEPMRDCVAVRFSGRPGSGKSTLMKLMMQVLGEMGVPCQQAREEETIVVGPLDQETLRFIRDESK